MKRIAVLAVLAVAGCDGGGASTAGSAGIQWRDGSEIDAAFAEAKSNGQPVMVYFTAVW